MTGPPRGFSKLPDFCQAGVETSSSCGLSRQACESLSLLELPPPICHSPAFLSGPSLPQCGWGRSHPCTKEGTWTGRAVAKVRRSGGLAASGSRLLGWLCPHKALSLGVSLGGSKFPLTGTSVRVDQGLVVTSPKALSPNVLRSRGFGVTGFAMKSSLSRLPGVLYPGAKHWLGFLRSQRQKLD